MSPVRVLRNLLLALGLASAAAAHGQPTVSATSTCSWCTLQITWSGLTSPATNDRLAVVKAGTTTPVYAARNTNGAASGTLPLNLSGLAIGNWEVRLFSPGPSNHVATGAFQIVPQVGGVITSGGSPLAGVAIAATNGANCSLVTNSGGAYGCLVPIGWSGSITPSKPGHLFSPASRSHTNVQGDQTTHNFTTAASRTVSGTITLGGSPLGGVAIAGTNGASCWTSTDAQGFYTCAVLPGWSGSVTPTLALHTFTPSSRSYTNVTVNQLSQGYAAEHYPIVSGTATLNGSPLAGVTMSATNGVTCTSSDAQGQYSCITSPGWSGSVTPSLGSRIFTPASRDYSSITTHQSAQDYATATYQVSGTVTTNGLPVAGVILSATNGTSCTTSDTSGQYSCTALGGWSGTITASLSGYTLTPASRDYMSIAGNETAQDYSAAVNSGAQRVYFIHPDHLNAPRLVSDATGTAVWRWDQQEPFGVNVPDENPSSLGAFEFPLRFPGQYADKETSVYYNYFRDYDPGFGRYMESDPIGLRGGLNTYAYVHAQPLTSIDPQGLRTLTDRLIRELADEVTGGIPTSAFGHACGVRLCHMGPRAGPPDSNVRQRWTLRLCEPAISQIPRSRSTADPVLECMETCNRIVDKCQKVEKGQVSLGCPVS